MAIVLRRNKAEQQRLIVSVHSSGNDIVMRGAMVIAHGMSVIWGAVRHT